jgi:hypothetical protein
MRFSSKSCQAESFIFWIFSDKFKNDVAANFSSCRNKYSIEIQHIELLLSHIIDTFRATAMIESSLPSRIALWYFLLALCPFVTSGLNLPQPTTMNRKQFFRQLSLVAISVLSVAQPANTLAFESSPKSPPASSAAAKINGSTNGQSTVAYKSLSLPIGEFGVDVPVACWFPVEQKEKQTSSDFPRVDPVSPQNVAYQHRISIRRIGQLLAGWNFIPEFASRDFALQPTSLSVTNGQDLPLPERGPIVLLAHGYLGSRFDLSHLAEELTKQGFTCLSPEFPESLAASYERMEGLDRSRITKSLLSAMSDDWKLQPSSYGIVGHSLGCGTVIKTGDASWARVCIAGFPRQQDGTPIPGDVLFLSSMNDGAVSLARFGGIKAIPSDYAILDEATLSLDRIPARAALIYDRPDAPNHISFLSGGVNDAMIDLLSPLLPLAQSMKIPVLDFDRYQLSRDSVPTADAVHPLVVAYLKQQMLKKQT